MGGPSEVAVLYYVSRLFMERKTNSSKREKARDRHMNWRRITHHILLVELRISSNRRPWNTKASRFSKNAAKTSTHRPSCRSYLVIRAWTKPGRQPNTQDVDRCETNVCCPPVTSDLLSAPRAVLQWRIRLVAPDRWTIKVRLNCQIIPNCTFNRLYDFCGVWRRDRWILSKLMGQRPLMNIKSHDIMGIKPSGTSKTLNKNRNRMDFIWLRSKLSGTV